MSSNEIEEKKPVVLMICNYYLPGYKAGGGLRTLVHMVERFKDKFDFRVITLDNDGDGKPYANIKADDWNEVEGAKVFYLSQDKMKISKLRELILNVQPDSIYLNSVFSTLTIFLLILRKLKRLPPVKVILAPEGEISDSALQLKALKKYTFIKFAKAANLYRDLIWKTTAEPEKQEAERFKGSGGQIFIAPNLPGLKLLENYNQELKLSKSGGTVKMIFLSRYMRKKNFKWLVDNLSVKTGFIEIDIYGPIEDKLYWEETEKSVKKLPENIKVNYKGHLEYNAAIEKLFEYHFFILPTLSENFGHVIIEALAAGCPVIVSDRTPWLNLEQKKIGWDIPLEEPGTWSKVINKCVKLNGIEYRKMSENAREFAEQWLSNPKVEEETLNVLRSSLEIGTASCN